MNMQVLEKQERQQKGITEVTIMWAVQQEEWALQHEVRFIT